MLDRLMCEHARLRRLRTALRQSRGPVRRYVDAGARAKVRAAIGLGILAALLVLPMVGLAQGADANERTRRIVILNATDPYLPAFVALDSAMRAAIRADSSVPVAFYAETLAMCAWPR